MEKHMIRDSKEKVAKCFHLFWGIPNKFNFKELAEKKRAAMGTLTSQLPWTFYLSQPH
jgi:hypothetical protein